MRRRSLGGQIGLGFSFQHLAAQGKSTLPMPSRVQYHPPIDSTGHCSWRGRTDQPAKLASQNMSELGSKSNSMDSFQKMVSNKYLIYAKFIKILFGPHPSFWPVPVVREGFESLPRVPLAHTWALVARERLENDRSGDAITGSSTAVPCFPHQIQVPRMPKVLWPYLCDSPSIVMFHHLRRCWRCFCCRPALPKPSGQPWRLRSPPVETQHNHFNPPNQGVLKAKGEAWNTVPCNSGLEHTAGWLPAPIPSRFNIQKKRGSHWNPLKTC